MTPEFRATGVVRNVCGDGVEVLLTYNRIGERKLCEIPRKFWKSQAPEPDQRVEVTWKEGDGEDLTISLLDVHTPVSFQSPTWAREFFGVSARSRVIVFVGPNPPTAYSTIKKIADHFRLEHHQARIRELSLKTAGWGECLALTRIPYLLQSLDVPPDNVANRICETTYTGFDPKEYGDYTVILIGSTKSNTVLAQHYWRQTGLATEYEFSGRALVVKKASAAISFEMEDNFGEDCTVSNPESVIVTDYFLLAKKRNPYGSGQCFVLAGIGTIGTGYAAVAMCGLRSAARLWKSHQGGEFDMIGRVEMKGMFNPQQDPVTCVYDGERTLSPPEMMLPHAISSPTVWSQSSYSQHDYADDRERFRKMLQP